ncbi:MAG: hypothetical protein ACNYPE_10680 [Candidatus Azotimanducaceae bacterium WSBS_2022_MAG_OTU7]
MLAVPGARYKSTGPGLPSTRGDGALLDESGGDVLERAGYWPRGYTGSFPGGIGLPPEQERLLELLAAGPCLWDNLLSDIELSIEDLTVAIVMLEILGLVHSEGGRFQLTQLQPT